MLQRSKEELHEMSLIEVAFQIFEDKGEAITFQSLLDEMSTILGLSKEEMQDKMVQFYTDLNIDGRFMTLGENRWGLREWYPIDQIDEEVVMQTKTKKKKKTKKTKKKDEELIEDLEEEELDYDLDDEDEDLLDDEEEDESLEALREEELEEDEEEFEDDIIDDEDKEYDLDDDEEEEEEEEE